MKKKAILLAAMLSIGAITIQAADGKSIAKQKNVSAASKGSAQWQRKFDKGDDPFTGLPAGDAKVLLDYLKAHAADSNAPEAAGM